MQEVERALAFGEQCIEIVAFPFRARDAADHERVPGGQNLVVEGRPRACAANPQQALPRALPVRVDGFAREAERCGDFLERRDGAQVPRMALEIRWATEVEATLDNGELRIVERCLDLVASPDVERAFLTVGVGVERAEKSATGRRHLADEPRAFVARGRQKRGIVVFACGARIQRQQLRVVVEHFFEVRNVPLRVDAVAEESAAEMIAKATLGHARQCEPRHFASGHAVRERAIPMGEQQLDLARMRKFRSTDVAAVLAIEARRDALERGADRPVVERIRVYARRAVLLEELRERAVLRADFFGFRIEPAAHAFEHLHERGLSVARRFGKYVPAKNGMRSSGVRNTVSGQPPPRRVSAWCAS